MEKHRHQPIRRDICSSGKAGSWKPLAGSAMNSLVVGSWGTPGWSREGQLAMEVDNKELRRLGPVGIYQLVRKHFI